MKWKEKLRNMEANLEAKFFMEADLEEEWEVTKIWDEKVPAQTN